MKLTQRIKSWFGGPFNGAQEGSTRGPFTFFGEFGNGFQVEPLGDGWQRHLSQGASESIAIVYACVMLNARAVSQCTPKHETKNNAGSFEQSKSSPAARILRKPNDYETFSQLALNTVSELLFRGESLWVAVRDDRFAITSVHRIPHGSWSVYIDSGEVFYNISSNENDLFTAPDYMVPARDVAHFRQHCPRHPLMGESPIKHAAMALGVNVALSKTQLAFFNNMNRPSGVLETEAQLNKEQKDQARAAFAEQSKTWNQGGLPILSHGVTFKPLSISSQDQELINAQKMSRTEIANVFGVPMSLLADSAGGTSAGSETMVNHWLSVGLGSVLESLETTIEKLFNTGFDDRIVLDTTALMRVNFEERITALGKMIQNGIATPNEVRLKEGFGDVDGGDEAFLQRQMTAMSTLKALNEAELADKLKAEPEPQPEPEPEPDPEESKAIALHAIRKAMTA